MYRVVLHAMTLNRDAPMMIILSRLLESMGCNVIVTSVRNYMAVIKYWRPHAILYGTLSKSKAIIRQWDKAKLFYCAGEGGESKEFMDENFYLDNEDIFERTLKIFVWGNKTKEYLAEKCHDKGMLDMERKILNGDKVIANGHPRLDLMHFMPSVSTKNKTIGINTNLNRLNAFDGRSTLHYLIQNDENFFWVRSELREAEVIIKTIEYIVRETPFNVSIRPYPNENKYMYKNTKIDLDKFPRKHFNGRVEIDDTLDYSSWISNQLLVISRVSTTITEAYQFNIPVIFIDRLAGNYDFFRNRSEIERLLVDTAYQPSTMDELCTAINNPESIPIKPDRLKELWSDYYGMDKPGSALKRIAKTIVSELDKGRHFCSPLLPKPVLRLYDEIIFRRVCWKNRFHTNFNFKEGYHDIPAHYTDIVRNILADTNN